MGVVGGAVIPFIQGLVNDSISFVALSVIFISLSLILFFTFNLKKMFSNDSRTVMTLDAGGTNFVFTAIQGNQEIVNPVVLPSHSGNLYVCLETIVEGFNMIEKMLDDRPVAISFAFPGPADYENGIIGDLPNFPHSVAVWH